MKNEDHPDQLNQINVMLKQSQKGHAIHLQFPDINSIKIAQPLSC